MVKIEALNPEIREIECLRFNFIWFTGYSPKMYHQVLDMLIHKDTKNHLPHSLRPILLFDIEANIHNKHLVVHSMRNAE